MRVLFYLAVTLLSSSAYAENFDVNLTGTEIKKQAGVLTVEDLAVGEVGISSPLFCIKDNKLFIPSDTVLMDSKLEYGATHRIRKEPGGSVKIDIVFGDKVSDKNPTTYIAKLLVGAIHSMPCKTLFMTNSNLVVVESINDMRNAKQALGLEKSAP